MSLESPTTLSVETAEPDIASILFIGNTAIGVASFLMILLYGKSDANRGALVAWTTSVAFLNAFGWWLIRNQ